MACVPDRLRGGQPDRNRSTPGPATGGRQRLPHPWFLRKDRPMRRSLVSLAIAASLVGAPVVLAAQPAFAASAGYSATQEGGDRRPVDPSTSAGEKRAAK